MNKNLIVILDCSGSFAENGKLEILRALRLSAASLAKKFGAKSEFFIWREDVQPMTKPKDIVAHGVSNFHALENFLTALDEDAKILLLSDGQWGVDDGAKMKSLLAAQKFNLIFVAVGAGAKSVGAKWSAADLPAAIQALLLGGAS